MESRSEVVCLFEAWERGERVWWVGGQSRAVGSHSNSRLSLTTLSSGKLFLIRAASSASARLRRRSLRLGIVVWLLCHVLYFTVVMERKKAHNKWQRIFPVSLQAKTMIPIPHAKRLASRLSTFAASLPLNTILWVRQNEENHTTPPPPPPS